MKNGAEVIIGSDKGPLAFLKNEFPDLEFVNFPGYNINYPKGKAMSLQMLLSIPKIINGISKENSLLKGLIQTQGIDGVISDNRFGLWSDKVKTVFITHQVKIRAPFFEGGIFRLNKNFINKYDYCWIPDAADKNNLSGNLGHGGDFPPNVHYIGPLSRFYSSKQTGSNKNTENILAIISGPEPQRSIFEDLIIRALKQSPYSAAVVRGLPESNEFSNSENIKVYSHLNTDKLAEEISKARIIISRPGYSTLMDLSVFGKKVILVPTPGQTEQEYLADYISSRNEAVVMKQDEFDLKEAVKMAEKAKPLRKFHNSSLLKDAVKSFLSTI